MRENYSAVGEVESMIPGYLEYHINEAVKLLKLHEPPNGYYLAFSGGKDSQAIYHLAILSGVKFDAHYNVTTVDPPEVVRFIKNNYPSVKFEHPKLTMIQLIAKKMIPPTRIIRYCCQHLKECGGIGRTVITGIRASESGRRLRDWGVVDTKRKNKTIINPILEWSEMVVWEYLESINVFSCELYDIPGWDRIGCVMCPMAGPKKRKRDADRYPKIANNYLRAFKKMLEASNSRGNGDRFSWKTPEEVMDWWLSQ